MTLENKRSSKAEIEDLIRARYSLIWVTSPEENRVEEALRKLCVEREMRLEVWSITEGFKTLANGQGTRDVKDPMKAIDHVIRAEGRAGQVLVTGKVTVAQLKALYLTSDALLVTSLHEGFCVPLVEAMALLTPVVAVPNAAVPGTGGDAALYADPTPEAIAARLHEVVADDAVRQAQLTRGRRRYADHFDNAAIERRFLALFDGL